jgi:poly(3-hydroxybutyrate) depolymerase
MDADYYLETIKTVFQEFSLVNGTWDVRGVDGKVERVRPADIKTTALFSVEGELDDISGSGQTEAVHSICSGVPSKLQKHLEAKGAGHYGIFSGRRWRDVVYPEVKSFILAHQPSVKLEKAEKLEKTPASVVSVEKVAEVPVKPQLLATETVAKTVAQVAVKKATPPVAKVARKK